uniref:Transposase Tc5 C-terminal domain-containing protein n=1 Tax=Acrobeloides nanus TaxID=290746 RepID=A0A914DHN3_9BILA
MDGTMPDPMLVILQEQGYKKTGKLGPRVSQNLFKAENIVIESNTSGKLDKEIWQQWNKEVLAPKIRSKAFLLVDSLSTYGDLSFLEESGIEVVIMKDITKDVEKHRKIMKDKFKQGLKKKCDKLLEVFVIPPGGTKYVQPFDTSIFRTWKNMERKINDRLLMEDPDIDIDDRNNILKRMALIHRQLNSPRFKNMLLYSWYSSQYLDMRPGPFINPAVYCFHNTIESCNSQGCNETSFFRCGWCQSYLCSNHLFTNFHNCKNYRE